MRPGNASRKHHSPPAPMAAAIRRERDSFCSDLSVYCVWKGSSECRRQVIEGISTRKQLSALVSQNLLFFMRYSLTEYTILYKYVLIKRFLCMILKSTSHNHYTLSYFSVYQSIFPFAYPTQPSQI